MEIWLDTAELDLIESAKQMGILQGVTTNPSIVSKAKMGLEDLLEKILNLQDGPVTVQVTATDAPKMIQQAEALFQFNNRIVVKVPVTSEGLKAIHALNQKHIPTMATAVFETKQVLLAARAGAQYIAPYYSTICEADIEGSEQFRAMLKLLERYKYGSKILGASLKSAEHVRQCIEMGAHAVTLNKEVFLALIENNDETVKRMDKFAKDWEGAEKRRILPLQFLSHLQIWSATLEE